jgi:periplasmic divalent cation tolerance protein
MADEQLSIILVTAPSPAVARYRTHDLVAERLAACVNVVPGITSLYTGEGQVEQAETALMIINTRWSCRVALEQYVRRHYPDDTPEIVETPADRGTPTCWACVMQGTTDV